jgi:hypothetical protein
MTVVERQERYRARRRIDGDRRICIWVKKDVADALQEVANALSITQKLFIEKLVLSVKRNLDERSQCKSRIDVQAPNPEINSKT